MSDRNKNRWFVGIITNVEHLLDVDGTEYTKITAESLKGYRRNFRPYSVKVAYIQGCHDFPVGSEVKWHPQESVHLNMHRPPYYLNTRVIVTVPTHVIRSVPPEPQKPKQPIQETVV